MDNLDISFITKILGQVDNNKSKMMKSNFTIIRNILLIIILLIIGQNYNIYAQANDLESLNQGITIVQNDTLYYCSGI